MTLINDTFVHMVAFYGGSRIAEDSRNVSIGYVVDRDKKKNWAEYPTHPTVLGLGLGI